MLVGKTTTIANAGDVQISRGITFPSVLIPCSNVNTLDDYSEGTWVPFMDSSPPGTGRVTTVRYATYTKIGNLVTFSAFITMGTLGTGGSGLFVVTGLPYLSNNVTDAYWAVTVPYFLNLKAPIMSFTGTIQPNNQYIAFRGYSSAVSSVLNLDFNTYIQAGTSLIFSGFYYT